jgi:hypothetical protein
MSDLRIRNPCRTARRGASAQLLDGEGVLRSGAGDFSASPQDALFRQTLIYCPDDAAPAGVTLVEEFFTGQTAKDFKFERPCCQ